MGAPNESRFYPTGRVAVRAACARAPCPQAAAVASHRPGHALPAAGAGGAVVGAGGAVGGAGAGGGAAWVGGPAGGTGERLGWPRGGAWSRRGPRSPAFVARE